MPKISVVMPVYNSEQFVGEAIESILNQTFKDFEFIIIDDCSTDGSYNICKKYADIDDRIYLLKNDENKGISYTRNKLIKLTNTNYIASQDSDDISSLDRLEICYNFLEENDEYAVVGGNNEIIDEEGSTIGYRKYSDEIEKIIIKKSPISQPSSLFRKDFYNKVGGYKESNKIGLEDYDLWLRFYYNGYKIKNINKFLLKYRIREGQSKSNVKKILKETIEVQENAINNYGINASLSDKIYIFLERILLILPEKIIFNLFKLFEYNTKK